jgi:hypothetical protein
MTTIDQAVEFFQGFARREYDAEVVFFRERDDAKVQEVLGAFNREFFDPPLHGRLMRPPMDDGFFERSDRSIAQRQPRPIFRVDRWRHPRHGELFAAHAGWNLAGVTRLASRFFAHDTPDGLRLISQYDLCRECRGTGDVDGRVCPECRGTGWEYFDGVEIEGLPEPEESRELGRWEDP